MLEALGIEFLVREPSPAADKSIPNHLPMGRLQQTLLQVAEAKARDVAESWTGAALVVGADTVVYAQGQVLGKPGGARLAREHLDKLSGKAHKVLSAVSVISTFTGEAINALETTEVRFRELTPLELEHYIATGEPFDKAGSYGIQGWGGLLVESIKGRYDNVVGFPLVTLESLLEKFGKSLYSFRSNPS